MFSRLTLARARQVDAYVNPVDVGDPEGGWEDYEGMFEAPWEEETWDHYGA